MRKSSSNSSRDSKPGGKSSFKKDDGRKPFSKDAKPFKKNYDGRGPASGGSGDGPRSKPYSGRVTDGDKPFSDRPKRSFDKPGGDKPFSDRPKHSFDNDDRGSSSDRKSFSDRPKRSFDKPGGDRPFSDRPKRSFDKDDRGSSSDRKPFSDRPKRSFDKPGGDKPFSDRPKRSFDKDDRGGSSDRKPFSDRPKRSFDKPGGDKPFSDRPKRSFDKDDRGGSDRKPFSDRPKRSFDKDDRNKERGDRKPGKSFDKNDKSSSSRGKQSFDNKEEEQQEKKPPTFSERSKRLFDKDNVNAEDGKVRKDGTKGGDSRPFRERNPKQPDVISFSKDIDTDDGVDEVEKPFKPKKLSIKKSPERDPEEKKERSPRTNSGKKKHYHNHDHDDEDEDDKEINQKEGPRLEMPLNKYIAHSGECSRRDAAEMVRSGKVKVNGELVLDPGYRVLSEDKVTLSGKKLTPQKGMVYILLNKPKGFITTNEDPQGRKTVMQLVGNAGVDRLFPVGRLDKDTSGLLLITNDGDLTQKLCHPAYNIKKVYQVTLDKPVTKADFEKIIAGVELEDGVAVVDAISYLETKKEIGLEIHSGRNRIVRRIFESLGYVVDKLDRVMYAGLTKKNLPRSKWRYLDEREIVLLKHFKN